MRLTFKLILLLLTLLIKKAHTYGKHFFFIINLIIFLNYFINLLIKNLKSAKVAIMVQVIIIAMMLMNIVMEFLASK